MKRITLITILAVLSSTLLAGKYPKVDISKVNTNISPFRETKTDKNIWKKRPFTILQTDLSPAWLIRSKTKEINFFYDIKKWGFGLPTSMACSIGGGKAKVVSGQKMKLLGREMKASWILVWFSGAKGWKNFDVPWLLVLQNKPTSVKLTENGLKLTFPKDVGFIGSMPFYGYWKSPKKDSKWVNNKGRKKRGIKTWEWKNGLPASVIKRADWWASYMRKIPIYAEEKFAIKGDDVVIKTNYKYKTTKDEWGTKPIDFAPIPPVLGLASETKWEPLSIKGKIIDPFLVTSWGPYLGVKGNSTEVVLKNILKYVHEKEIYTKPTSGTGKEALDKLQAWYKQRLRYSKQYWPPWGMENLVWSTAGADFIIPKLLEYTDQKTKADVIKKFDPWMKDYLLSETFEYKGKKYKFWNKQKVGNKTYYCVNGPGIGGDVFGDGGKLANNALYTFWCYAHYMDRWDVINKNWDRIKSTLLTPLNMDWKSVGRQAIAEMGDECQPVMGMARMAYRVGDADTYAYASYIFAKQAVHHYVKSKGGQYYKENQPMHRTKELPDAYYLTNMLGHTMGWSPGGPGTGSTQWTNRFVRFNDEDIGRMHKDYLGDFHKKELDNLEKLWSGFKSSGHTVKYSKIKDRSHIEPCVTRLRGFLLDEKVEKLAKITKPSKIIDDSGLPMAMFAYIRASVPRKYERLIDKKNNETPFLLGKERDAGAFSPFTVQFGRFTKYWPVPTWYCPAEWNRKAQGGFPNPNGYLNYGTREDRSFGAIKPGDKVWAKNGVVNQLNWNTQITSWDISTVAPVNLANKKHGTVARTISMENDFYQPWRLIDGDLNSPWASKRLKKGAVENWFEIEFPKVKTVATLAIHGGKKIKKIEVSIDGTTFKEAKTKPIEQLTEIRFVSPIKAKIIKVTFIPTRHIVIKEVEAFGPTK